MPTLTRIFGYMYDAEGNVLNQGVLSMRLQQDIISVDGTKVAPFVVEHDFSSATLFDVDVYATIGAYPESVAYYVEFDPDPTDTSRAPYQKDGYWRNYWEVDNVASLGLGTFLPALRGEPNFTPSAVGSVGTGTVNTHAKWVTINTLGNSNIAESGIITTATGDFVVTANTTLTGTVTSGLINGQTISSAASFTGTVAVATSMTVGSTINGQTISSAASFTGTVAVASTINGQTISSAANFTGTVAVASTINSQTISSAANFTGTVAVASTMTVGGTINSQTISSAANFTGTMAVATSITVATSVLLNSTGTAFKDTGALAWSSTSSPSGTADVFLYRDGTGLLAQRNSGLAQSFLVYNTTDGTNKEFGSIGWVSSAFVVTSDKAGTGTYRNMVFAAGGSQRWKLDTSGHLSPITTNAVDIGLTATTVRSIYIGTSLVCPTITTPTTTDLTLDPTGLIITKKDLAPFTNYNSDIGTVIKKYKAIYAGELIVETLVSQDVMATIGGRIVVAPSTSLTADLAPGDTTITVKHNNLANGHRILLQSAESGTAKMEWMSVDSAAGGSAGAYTYSVTRNLDLTGANQWYAGDAVLNTGTTGSGFIDLYSTAGILSGTGPTIVGNVRTGATYSSVETRWAIGNLRSLYGYSSGADEYGAAFGVPSAAWVKIDPTNGVRIGHNATTYISLDAAGNATFSGTVTATLGAIGGWTIGATTLTGGNATLSSTGVLTLGTSTDVVILSAVDGTYRLWVGHSTAASAPFRVTKAGAITATSGTIGGWTLASTTLTGTNTTLDSAGIVTLGTSNDVFIASAADATYRLWIGHATAASAPFRVSKTGAMTTVSGSVGGWTLGATSLTSGSGATTVGLDSGGSNPAIYAGSATPGSAPFRVTNAGALTATSGTVGGWTLSSSTLVGGNATLNSSGNLTLGTSNDVVRLSADDATYRLWVGHATAASAPFYVTKAGALLASNANITGAITATSGSFTGTITSTLGTIGGWTLSSTTLTGGSVTIDSAGSIRAGMSGYLTGTGFWLGTSGGTPYFSIGTSSKYLAWNGGTTGLYIYGADITLGSASAYDSSAAIKFARDTSFSSTQVFGVWAIGSGGSYQELYIDNLAYRSGIGSAPATVWVRAIGWNISGNTTTGEASIKLDSRIGALSVSLYATNIYMNSSTVELTGHTLQANGAYIYPGSANASGSYQTSWYLASHSAWGLYTNTGLYVSGATGLNSTLYVGGSSSFGNMSTPAYVVDIHASVPSNYVARVFNPSTSGYGLIVIGGGTGGELVQAWYDYASNVVGYVSAAGVWYNASTTWSVMSDRNAKRNIRDYGGALDKIRQVQIREYDYTGEFGRKAERGVGVVAQEIRDIFPQSVDISLQQRVPDLKDPSVNREPVLTFNSSELFMANVAAVIELDGQVQTLEARVTALEKAK